jgi:hypothetical protein
MRVAMATVVALLMLSFVDEHFNDTRFVQAAATMFFSNRPIIQLGAANYGKEIPGRHGGYATART